MLASKISYSVKIAHHGGDEGRKEFEMLDLKQVREIKGLSQQDVADILDIPKRTIEDWERGKRKAPEYVSRLINEKLLNIPTEQIEFEKQYIVVEYSAIMGESILFVGSKNECNEVEDEIRKVLTSDQKQVIDYAVVRMAEYEKMCQYTDALQEYVDGLTDKQKREVVEIGGKKYAKHVLDFQKLYYNNVN